MYGQNSGFHPDAPGWPNLARGFVSQICFVFLSFRNSERWDEKCGSCGGRNFPSPIEKAHHLYNSLLLLCKLWLNNYAVDR